MKLLMTERKNIYYTVFPDTLYVCNTFVKTIRNEKK